MIPAYLSAVSLGLLLLNALFSSPLFQKLQRTIFSSRSANDQPKQVEPSDIPVAEGHGGPIITAYNVLRLLGCLAVTGLSITSMLLTRSGGGAPSVVYAQLAQCISMVRSHSHILLYTCQLYSHARNAGVYLPALHSFFELITEAATCHVRSCERPAAGRIRGVFLPRHMPVSHLLLAARGCTRWWAVVGPDWCVISDRYCYSTGQA